MVDLKRTVNYRRDIMDPYLYVYPVANSGDDGG